MVNFHVLIDEDAQKFLDDLPSKSNRIVKDKLKLLEVDLSQESTATKSYSISLITTPIVCT